MSPTETVTVLRQLMNWLRDKSNWPPSPMQIEKAIAAAIEHLEPDAESLAMHRKVRDERDELRAKLAEMERQEPVEWQTRTRPAWDGTWRPWRKCSEEYAEDIKKTPLLHDWLYEARALYALPGAQTQGEEK